MALACHCEALEDGGGGSVSVGLCPQHHPHAITSLLLHDQHLTEPPLLTALLNLQVLSLAFNGLTHGPDLSPCAHLRRLNLSHNTVVELPALPPRLEALDVSCNQLRSLHGVAACTKLEELWLTGNPVESLRQLVHLKPLSSLRHLFAADMPVVSTATFDVVHNVAVYVVPSLQSLCLVLPQVAHRGLRFRSSADNAGVHTITPAALQLATQWLSSKPGRDCLAALNEEACPHGPAPPTVPLPRTVLRAAAASEPRVSLRASKAASGARPRAEAPSRHPAEDPESHSVSPPPPPPSSIAGAVSSLPDLSGFGAGAPTTAVAASPKPRGGRTRKRRGGGAPPRSVWPPGALPQTQASPPEPSPLCTTYPKTGGAAVDVFPDGTAVAKWPTGTLAVSVDTDPDATAEFLKSCTSVPDGATVQLYRLLATCREAKAHAPTVTMDAYGAGSIQTPAGVTVLTAMGDGSGFMYNPSTGALYVQWNAAGDITSGPTGGGDGLGYSFDPATKVFKMKAGKHMGVVYDLNTRGLEVFFKCDGVHHRFLQGFNTGQGAVAAGKSLFGGTSGRREEKAEAAASLSRRGHAATLSDIRAAVSDLA